MISLAGVLFLVQHALVFAVLTATCFVLGRRLLGDHGRESGGEGFALSTGVGLGAAGLLLFGLGLLGGLTAGSVSALVVLIHLTGFSVWRDGLTRIRTSDNRGLFSSDSLPWLPAALTVALVALLSFYPPTSFDATSYHLPYARAFAQAHRVVSLPGRRFPVFPQLSEVVFSATLLGGDDTDAARVELLALLVGLAALSGGARRRSGTAAGPWAASAWIGCPAVALLSASAYVDVGFTMFALLAFIAWDRWREEGLGRWIVVSAALA
ncbi:MAG TPA: hypothetical protein VGO79_06380, partial [Thermoanaerobaculia bacterium]